MSGTLPPQWSTLDLNTLNLDRNALTGKSGTMQQTTIRPCTLLLLQGVVP